MDMETSRLLPVSVLTGFLGSGKTTVLNHLMQQPEMKDRRQRGTETEALNALE